MKKIMFILLLLSVGVVPFVFLPQWAGYVGLFGFEYTKEYQTPFIVLMIREGLPILFAALVFLTHRSFLKYRSFTAVFIFTLLLIFVFTLVLVSPVAAKLKIIAAITGVRFCMFILLPYAVFVFFNGMSSYYCESRLNVLLKVLIGILLINIVVSLFPSQLEWALSGKTILGQRAIGITNGPNSSGAVMGIGALLLLFRKKFDWVWIGICAIFFFGALLTGSRTSVLGTIAISMMSLFIIHNKSKFLKLLIVILLIIFPYLLINLTNISRYAGKATPEEQASIKDESDPSIEYRIAWFRQAVDRMSLKELLIGYGLGYGTNLASRDKDIMDQNDDGLVVVDSLITLSVINFGFFGATLFCIIIAYFFNTLASFWPGIVFSLYFFIFGTTQNLVESYPTTVLFGVLLGCYAVYSKLPFNNFQKGNIDGATANINLIS